jgi:glycosyltransferase involved in cell wall biosynthesis
MWKQGRIQMQIVEDSNFSAGEIPLPISVIVPVRNEARNLPRCLDSLRGVGEVYVIDSHSTDATCEIARSHGARVVQFDYQGGWPKKRQWALDTLSFVHDWILLLDADETLTPELIAEIGQAIANPGIDGYHIALRMYFLGRVLRHGDSSFSKLSLFRKGKGHFECRLKDQNASMCDMEVHEHVVVDGPTVRLSHPLVHHNIDSLSRYIQKHDSYSNWEAGVWAQKQAIAEEVAPGLRGSQAQRRRWLKAKLMNFPGSPILFFLYKYFFRLGLLDGRPGLTYAVFQATQLFHIKAKLFELREASSVKPDTSETKVAFTASSQAAQ